MKIRPNDIVLHKPNGMLNFIEELTKEVLNERNE